MSTFSRRRSARRKYTPRIQESTLEEHQKGLRGEIDVWSYAGWHYFWVKGVLNRTPYTIDTARYSKRGESKAYRRITNVLYAALAAIICFVASIIYIYLH